MGWREELRGVRRVDLASAVLLVPTLAFGAYVIAQDAQETREQTQVQETQVTDADDYAAVWDWCGVRYPHREDLQDACKFGAYEMLPDHEGPHQEITNT